VGDFIGAKLGRSNGLDFKLNLSYMGRLGKKAKGVLKNFLIMAINWKG
jgi:hypothetical protein